MDWWALGAIVAVIWVGEGVRQLVHSTHVAQVENLKGIANRISTLEAEVKEVSRELALRRWESEDDAP